jgi:hypothetical protein
MTILPCVEYIRLDLEWQNDASDYWCCSVYNEQSAVFPAHGNNEAFHCCVVFPPLSDAMHRR